MTKRIEIEFGCDVEITDEQHRDLGLLIDRIIEANTPEGYAHWLSSGGLKPLWSNRDAAIFPDLGGGRSGAESGEPEYDEDTVYLQTTCRKEWRK